MFTEESQPTGLVTEQDRYARYEEVEEQFIPRGKGSGKRVKYTATKAQRAQQGIEAQLLQSEREVEEHQDFASQVDRLKARIAESGGEIVFQRFYNFLFPLIIDPKTPLVLLSKDLKYTFNTAGGPGGQNVNKVATATRVTHKPTLISASNRETRHQAENKIRAYAQLEQLVSANVDMWRTLLQGVSKENLKNEILHLLQ